MKSLISILFLLVALNAGAQKVRFTDKTNRWNTMTVDHDGVTGNLSYVYDAADVLLHGNWYQCITSTGHWLYAIGCAYSIAVPTECFFVREDTMLQRVFYFSVADSMEYLLYDYNMHVGDSIHYHNYSSTYTDTVVNIDSVLYNGYYYKIFSMRSGSILGSVWRDYTVLEGVGGTNYPGFPVGYITCFEGGESLVCFYEGGIRPELRAPVGCYAYSSTLCPAFTGGSIFDNTGVCGSLLSADQSQIKKVRIAISPNPAFDHIDIALEGQNINTTVSVYDVSGKCISKAHADGFKNTQTINTSSWPGGLYLVIIQDNTGILKKEKVQVMH